VKSVASKGTVTVLKAANRTETNTIKDPQHLIPVTEKVKGLGTSFIRTFPPCSVTVLELDAR
jgi:alpha-N-arabinofuranosidase